MKNVLLNPVLNKEFKLRFRSIKSILGISFYLLALIVLIIGFIYLERQNSPMGLFRPDQSRNMFILLSFIQLGLILFITPGLTAGVISGEREKQTLNILLTTNQSSTSIILGKLLSSISYLLLMIVASLPVYCIVFLFGGISPIQVLVNLAYYTFTILVFGSIGIFFSTLIRKTIISMICTYGVTLLLTAGTAFLFLISMSVTQMNGNSHPGMGSYLIAMLNPVMIMLSFLEPTVFRELTDNISTDLPLWAANVLSFGVITLVITIISIKNLRPSMKVKR
ncbi:ABC transporter permease [Neobacillus sp. LXY-1]|uniref:ABC transporter permease n=1 Tax=Neobacillus sp. LXY-1 TaxID=3379133 RepID=UPI003EE34F3E